MAAEHGSGPAAWSLGCLYPKGKGVFADLEQAQEWFERAAELDHRTALVISYLRWYPEGEALTQTLLAPFHVTYQLSGDEMLLLKNSGMKRSLGTNGRQSGGVWIDRSI
ncbi:MAG: sel1 repeat family protein [Acidobacteriaceae bacterium]|nr:sel1 repeat family protein [Acidobacteriaceae bacterium]